MSLIAHGYRLLLAGLANVEIIDFQLTPTGRVVRVARHQARRVRGHATHKAQELGIMLRVRGHMQSLPVQKSKARCYTFTPWMEADDAAQRRSVSEQMQRLVRSNGACE